VLTSVCSILIIIIRAKWFQTVENAARIEAWQEIIQVFETYANWNVQAAGNLRLLILDERINGLGRQMLWGDKWGPDYVCWRRLVLHPEHKSNYTFREPNE
jgi:hypothetical protein